MAGVTSKSAAVPQARLTGLLYLAYFASAAPLALRTEMISPGDAAATAGRILASESLYRLTLATDFLSYALYVVVTFMLYRLFRPVGRDVALLAAFLSLTGCAVLAVSSVVLFTPLVLLTGSASGSTFTLGQLQSLALAAFELHGAGYAASLVFFGAFCLVLGSLAIRARFLPRILGALLMLAGAGWLAESFAAIASPPLGRALTPYVNPLGAGAELLLALWLALFGVNTAKWPAQAEAEPSA